jgi:hypothetical protein
MTFKYIATVTNATTSLCKIITKQKSSIFGFKKLIFRTDPTVITDNGKAPDSASWSFWPSTLLFVHRDGPLRWEKSIKKTMDLYQGPPFGQELTSSADESKYQQIQNLL